MKRRQTYPTCYPASDDECFHYPAVAHNLLRVLASTRGSLQTTPHTVLQDAQLPSAIPRAGWTCTVTRPSKKHSQIISKINTTILRNPRLYHFLLSTPSNRRLRPKNPRTLAVLLDSTISRHTTVDLQRANIIPPPPHLTPRR